MDNYKITQNGKTLKQFSSGDKLHVIKHMQMITSQSCHHAIKYDGYEIFKNDENISDQFIWKSEEVFPE